MRILFIFIVFMANAVFAVIPLQFVEHIEREIDVIAEGLNHPLKPSEELMMLSRYVDSMVDLYQCQDVDSDEVIAEITKRLPKRDVDIDARKDKQIIHFRFEGVEIPIIFTDEVTELFDKKRYFVPAIHRDSKHEFYRNYNFPCLNFVIDEDALLVLYLNPRANACPTPSFNGAGNFLLYMLEAYAKFHRLKRISLWDDANVSSFDYKYEAKLRHLYTFKNGMSWYNKHGFYTEKGREYDLLQGEQLKNMNMDEILFSFDDIVGNAAELEKALMAKYPDEETFVWQYYDKIQENFKSLFKLVGRYRKEISSNVRLGDFFLWTWKAAPEQYGDLIELVFPELYREYMFPDCHKNLAELGIPACTMTKIVQVD